ncbi:RnfH family protein [Rhodoferax sp. 4810]|uniref:UPF0125 protein HUK38_00180 n=1 Tax=Thiospirillum jenense TaxID=1653858 RepID=A0A839HBP3_9GAMM|nr:RnfH family protein [Thiospirillum jenense]MBB1073192.1 RnfH family protein [Rhodoferax jenense]MBB1124647.1 RnfH family protein [Thiospirillum jenense]
MQTTIIYAQSKRQMSLTVTIPEGATIQEAIEKSGILNQCPEINLDENKVGIFGKITPLTTALVEGDRVEIYRPLTVDPKTVLRGGAH